MNIDYIKQKIESLKDETEIVYLYSIAIEHFTELKEQINFVENPIPIRNDINTILSQHLKDTIDNGIEECKKMIQFHLNYRKTHSKDINISDKKVKSKEFKFEYR